MTIGTETKNKLKIIYAEDDINTNHLVSNILKAYSFIEVDSVFNDKEFFNFCKAKNYDLVITDIKIFSMHGLDAIENIKNLLPNIKSIITTENIDTELLKKSIKLGVVDYFYKPLNTKELVQSILEVYENKVKNLTIFNENKKIEKAINHANIGIFSYKVSEDELYWDKVMTKLYNNLNIEEKDDWLNSIENEDKKRFETIFNIENKKIHNLNNFDEILKVTVYKEIKYIRFTGFYEENDGLEIIGINQDITELMISKLDIAHQKDQLELALISIKKKNEKLKNLALTDELTQLYNRKAFNERIYELIEYHKRYSTTFSFLLFDIDHFKSINDDFGHLFGDEVLIKISEVVSSVIRVNDYFFRIGGEEFVILFSDTHIKKALSIAKKIKKSIEQEVNIVKNRKITISIGVTEVQKDDDHDKIFKRVDEYLYEAKNKGRNTIVSK